MRTSVLGFHGKVLLAGAYRGGFCENLLEASPMSDRASASWLQDGPTDWPRLSPSATVVVPLG